VAFDMLGHARHVKFPKRKKGFGNAEALFASWSE
jgi:hypothetical protein